MSKAYFDANPKKKMSYKVTTGAMRKLCQRPGRKDEHGEPQYTTEQAHREQCDVNLIIRKYDKTGLILHVNKIEHKFGDMTANDFAMMQKIVTEAKSSFEALPTEIKNEFHNSPEEFLRFMEDPKNRDRALELGLIDADWTEETDGIGEHIEDESQRETFEEKKKREEEESNAGK